MGSILNHRTIYRDGSKQASEEWAQDNDFSLRQIAKVASDKEQLYCSLIQATSGLVVARFHHARHRLGSIGNESRKTCSSKRAEMERKTRTSEAAQF